MEEGWAPITVEVRPAARARSNFCVWNCSMAVKTWGGEAKHGWLVQEEPLLYQFVYHVVWLSPRGELLDITPHQNKTDRVVFLPTVAQDPEDEKVVPNLWFPRVNDQSVEELVRLLDLEFRTWVKFMNKSKFKGGLPRPIRREIARRYKKIEERIELLRSENQ